MLATSPGVHSSSSDIVATVVGKALLEAQSEGRQPCRPEEAVLPQSIGGLLFRQQTADAFAFANRYATAGGAGRDSAPRPLTAITKREVGRT